SNSPANLLIADTGNNRIRVLGASGASTYGVATGTNNIDHLAGFNNGAAGVATDGNSANSEGLTGPVGFAVDPSGPQFLFVVDSGNHQVGRIDSTGLIATDAGTGDPQGAVGSTITDPSPTVTFTGVPAGTYALEADAVDGGGASLVQGGAKTSTNS